LDLTLPCCASKRKIIMPDTNLGFDNTDWVLFHSPFRFVKFLLVPVKSRNIVCVCCL
jgi:hypothetical protein